MESGDIIYIPSFGYSHILSPESDAHARAVMTDFVGAMPYADPPSNDTGVYARIIDVIEPNVISFSTFPASTGTVEVGVIRGIFEPVSDVSIIDQLLAGFHPHASNTLRERSFRVAPVEERVVIQTDDLPEAIGTINAVFEAPVPLEFTVEEVKKEEPKKPVKKSRREELEENLDAVFEGHWTWEGNRERSKAVIIHWPEFEITNSNKNKHLITDLFIRVSFAGPSLMRLAGTFSGKRGSLSSKEVWSGYRHSHLPRHTNDWGVFCLGYSSMNQMVQDMMEDFDADMFYVFLVHLDQYARWESLEGGPYLGMSRIHEYMPLNLTSRQPQQVVRFVQPYIPHVNGCAIRVLGSIPPGSIYRMVNPDLSVRYSLKLGGQTGQDLLALITTHWSGPMHAFDENTNEYVAGEYDNSNNGNLDFEELVRRWSRHAQIPLAEGKTHTPFVTDSPERIKTVQRRIVNKPSPVDYACVIEAINAALNLDHFGETRSQIEISSRQAVLR